MSRFVVALVVVVCLLAAVTFVLAYYRQAATSPLPVVVDYTPLAVRVGDKVLIQGVVRAVVPHGKGVVVEIQPGRGK